MAEDALRAAEESLRGGRWGEAREQLAVVLSAGETGDALDGMGTALWWLGRVRESLGYRERAYAAYLAQHRHAEAAMVAMDVSVSYLSNLDDPAVARGWIARARRAADLSGDEHLTGWLWLMEGYTSDDPEIQLELLTRALSRGRDTGDIDMELAALADLGLALVMNGEVPRGLGLLDEAMAGTLAGEWERPDTVVWASCSMLAACSMVGDQRRAAQWCRAAERFAETYGCPFLQVVCRSHYGRVLVATGDWPLAETELNYALSMAAECGRAPRIEALAGLAEIRLRQGAVEEAERLLSDAGDCPEVALVSAEVLIARGHPERAVAVLEAELVSVARHELAYPTLAAGLVDAHLARGDADSAARISRSLQDLSGHQHPQARAVTERSCGRVAAALGEPEQGAQRLRKAIAEYDELELPFQSARTRFELAEMVADVQSSLAIVEAGRALDRLERLGAVREADAVAAFLRTLGVATKPGPRHAGLLSQREREVLALVQRGLTNREIASELYISSKTVAHHVSNILAKLNLRTRAEAAAFAATHPNTANVGAAPG